MSEVFKDALDGVMTMLIWFVKKAMSAMSDLYSMLFILLVLAALAAFGRKMKHEIYLATCARISCPDVRNLTICGCLSCGWIIMDLMCPCICHRYRPKFYCRVIIVQAKYLTQDNWLSNIPLYGELYERMKVYVTVKCGNNEWRTTSVREYQTGSIVTEEANRNTVVWNEPMELVIMPSNQEIKFEVSTEDDTLVGHCAAHVGSFYEDDGFCPWVYTSCGGTSCPEWLCSCFKPNWPKVMGAPPRGLRKVMKATLKNDISEGGGGQDEEPLMSASLPDHMPKPAVLGLKNGSTETGMLSVYFVLHDANWSAPTVGEPVRANDGLSD